MALFDPDAAAGPDSGVFGLACAPGEALVHIVPVPFDATASYRKGAWKAPEAILQASRQVDLYDLLFGRPYEAGICMLPADPRIAAAHEEASSLADGVIAAGGRVAGDRALEAALARVNTLGGEVAGIVREQTARVLDQQRLPCVLGGDHSAPFGAIQACAERFPGLGVLHFDAHADLRPAYEGFEWSHASIMDNVLRRIDGVARLVQVGIRDLAGEEHARIARESARVRVLYGPAWDRARLEGRDLRALVREHIEALPEQVFVSFDVDGLDPVLCPNTGTPVPGGLSWSETMLWLEELAHSGRRVVGLDLNEVNPGPAWTPGDAEDSWDAIVGARLLYRLIGAALRTR